jgi:Regulator of ribonuclease activity B
VDYEDSVDRDAEGEEATDTMCCICGAAVPIEYATAIVLTPPGDDEDSEQQLFCHGHHLAHLFHRSVALHPAIAGEPASEEEPQDDEPAVIRALEAQFARNDLLLEELHALGVDLTALAPVSVQFVARKHLDAAHLAAAVRDDGYLVLVLAPEADESGPWHVEASIEQSPRTAGSDEVTRQLVRLAVSFEAEYNGWSVSRQPR